MTTAHDVHGPVRTPDDLLEHWRTLMGPGGFGMRSLWVLWFDADDHQLPVVMPVDDIPVDPDPRLVVNLLEVLATCLREHAPDGSVAIALSRPGPPGPNEDDRAWGRALLAAATRTGVPLRPLHVATYECVRPLRPDDLVSR